MTKKDYIIVAKCLNYAYKPEIEIFNDPKNQGTEAEHKAAEKIGMLWDILEAIQREFPKDNPKFDWPKFKKAVYQ